MGSPGLELQRQSCQQHQLQQRREHQQQQPPRAAAPAHRPLPAPHPSHRHLHHRQQRCDHEPGGQLVSSFNYQSKNLAFFFFWGRCVEGMLEVELHLFLCKIFLHGIAKRRKNKISKGSLVFLYPFVCCAYTRVGHSCSKSEGSHYS